MARTTISASDVLMERVSRHVEKTGETLSAFYNRAILNQLENDGDFEVRDLIALQQEESEDGNSSEQQTTY